MWQEISKIGKKLVLQGLASAHFGNISIRKGKKILITAHNSLLDELDKNAFVEVDLDKPVPKVKKASAETIVHQRIYQNIPTSAIIHTHSPFAIIQSMISKESVLIPQDCESKYFLRGIPIVTGEPGTSELADNVAKALKNYHGVIVKGHGTFAYGKNLQQAYLVVCSIEQACKIKYFTDLYGYFRKNCNRKKEKFKRTEK
jgi:L-fuculose-phosphate aldolase